MKCCQAAQERQYFTQNKKSWKESAMSVFMTNEIGCFAEQRQWVVYESSLDTDLRVSRMTMDGNIWIVLLEEYAVGNIGSSPEGAVGE